jgi:hypothetical protein
LLAAFERGRKVPNDQWPKAPPREIDPPQLSVLVEYLQVVLGHLALQMKLSLSLVCTVSDIRNVIRQAMGEKTGPSLMNEGWRLRHVRPQLDAILKGHYALRVGKLQANAPLQLISLTNSQSLRDVDDTEEMKSYTGEQ